MPGPTRLGTFAAAAAVLFTLLLAFTFSLANAVLSSLAGCGSEGHATTILSVGRGGFHGGGLQGQGQGRQLCRHPNGTAFDHRKMVNRTIELWRHGQRLLFFQHLRKTGGTTMCSLLSQNSQLRTSPRYNCQTSRMGGPSGPFTYSSLFQLYHGELDSKNLNVYANEFYPFPDYVDFDDPRNAAWAFLTILRDPLDRLVSMAKITHPSLDSDELGKLLISLSQSNTLIAPNHYVKIFSGFSCRTCSNTEKLQRRAFLSVEECKCTQKKVDRSDLMKAKEALSRFTVVLITEWFTESSALLKQTLGIQHLDTSAKNVNGDSGRWEIAKGSQGQNGIAFMDVHLRSSEETIYHNNRHTEAVSVLSRRWYTKLRDLNSLDFELYEYAKQLCMCQAQTWLFQQ